MATAEFVQNGAALDYVNSGDTKIAAGTVVVFGDRIGVAGTDIEAGATGSVFVEGVFELPKDYGDSGKALTLGQSVYWDAENSCIKAAVAQEIGTGGDAGKVTTEASAVNGFAVKAALTTDQTAVIKINA